MSNNKQAKYNVNLSIMGMGASPIHSEYISVDSIDQASEVVSRYVNGDNPTEEVLGMSNFMGGDIVENGKKIARVSLNGRVWDLNDNEIILDKNKESVKSVYSVNHEQIMQTLIEDYQIDPKDAQTLATMSLKDVNKAMESHYQDEMDAIANPTDNKNSLIDKIMYLSFESGDIYIDRLAEMGLKNYLEENNITVDSLNGLAPSKKFIEFNENNIHIKGSEALVKVISLAIQSVYTEENKIYGSKKLEDMLAYIDKKYKEENNHLTEQNNDLTDLHKNQMGIRVLEVGNTKDNDLLLLTLSDPDLYDQFTKNTISKNPKSNWVQNMNELSYQFNLTDDELELLSSKLGMFSKYNKEQSKNPDWDQMTLINKTTMVSESIESSNGTEGEIDLNFADRLKRIREETMGISIKNNSGTKFKEGFTTTLIDANQEFLASVQIYDHKEDPNYEKDFWVDFRLPSENEDMGLENMLMLNAIALIPRMNNNPIVELIDNSITKTIMTRLEKAGLINNYDGSYSLTGLGEEKLKNREMRHISQAKPEIKNKIIKKPPTKSIMEMNK